MFHNVEQIRGGTLIQALERAAKILKIAARNADGVRLCELARECGLKRNTLYNLAETLVQEELLSKTEDGKYIIGSFINNFADARKRSNYLDHIYDVFSELQKKYPEASFYYSELGQIDIVGKIFFVAGAKGKGIYLENATLNPYMSVAGVIFFAFTHEEQLESLKQKNPFAYQGLNVWGSEKNFRKQIELARKNGYSETPPIIPENELKIGVPVRKKTGGLAGAVTFQMQKLLKNEREKIISDIIDAIKKISV